MLLHQSKQIEYIHLCNYKKVIFSILLFFYGFIVSAQINFSKIEINNYNRLYYSAGIQNWGICSDSLNRLYIANNEGLLTYNGTNWNLYPLPNGTILRSINFDKHKKLFVGGQNEFGYYEPNNKGELTYFSLSKLLPSTEKYIEDIWDIEIVDNSVFFRSNAKILRYVNNKLEIFNSQQSWISMVKYQNYILAQDGNLGIQKFENDKWQPFVSQSDLPKNCVITDMKPFNKESDTCIFSTAGDGLFLIFGNKIIPFYNEIANTEKNIISLSFLDADNFLIGTHNNGVFQLNKKGVVKAHFSNKNGLSNNRVHGISIVGNNKIWLSLDNGLASLDGHYAIKHLNLPVFENGGGYATKIYKGDIYYALSTGIVKHKFTNTTNDIKPEVLMKGLTWNLSLVNQKLLAARDDGLWNLTNSKPELLENFAGFWNGISIDNLPSVQMIAGHYTGIRLFKNYDNGFVNTGDILNFKESSRFLETKGNHIWVSHPYRGVFKINALNSLVEHYSITSGLPSDLDNHVFKIKGQIIFATSGGIYEYDSISNKMIKAKNYQQLFGQKPIRYLQEDLAGNVWFIQNKMIGFIDNTDNSKLIYIPELQNKMLSGFENIYGLNNSNVLIGSESGFYELNVLKYKEKIVRFKAYVSTIKLVGIKDSTLYGGFFSDNKMKNLILPYKFNSLNFAFASSDYGAELPIDYCYFLEGFDKDWSSWSSNTSKEYTNLPEGKYSFKVKARKSLSDESQIYICFFEIRAPWYRTMLAYLLYSIFTFGILYLLYRMVEKKNKQKLINQQKINFEIFEKKQKEAFYQHQLALEKTDKEIISLKNKTLSSEIEFKNAELANSTMHLLQKKEFLLKLINDLNKVCKENSEIVDKKEIKKIVKKLNSDNKIDEEWDQFSNYFNNVHSDFLNRLKSIYQQLTANDLKLCAYLRMNLSSKEISQLLNISVRGVEIGRYRLRKKLLLETEVNIYEFLLKI